MAEKVNKIKRGLQLLIFCVILAWEFPVQAKVVQVGAMAVNDYHWVHASYEEWRLTGLPDGYYIMLSAKYSPIYWETWFPYVLVEFFPPGVNQITMYSKYPYDYPLRVRWIFYGFVHTCTLEYSPLPRHDKRVAFTIPSCLPAGEKFRYVGFQTLPDPDSVEYPDSLWVLLDAFTINVDIGEPQAYLPLEIK